MKCNTDLWLLPQYEYCSNLNLKGKRFFFVLVDKVFYLLDLDTATESYTSYDFFREARLSPAWIIFSPFLFFFIFFRTFFVGGTDHCVIFCLENQKKSRMITNFLDEQTKVTNVKSIQLLVGFFLHDKTTLKIWGQILTERRARKSWRETQSCV